MAKLKIFTYPEIVLTQTAQPIARVEKSYWGLADNMLETMYDAPGIGLAANQVGVLERIIVLDTEYEVDDEDDIDGEPRPESRIIRKKDPIVMINPEIIVREGMQKCEEGCLSVPDYTSEVERAKKIVVRYLDLDGLEKTLATEGLQAVAVQHELDHLNGTLFIDRLSQLKRDMARKKVIKAKKSQE